MNLIFNPEYLLKPDDGGALLVPKENIIDNEFMSDNNFFMRVHSIHAAILSFFDGTRPQEEAIAAAAEFVNVQPSTITSFLEKITDNPERLAAHYKDTYIAFPKKCMIYSDEVRTHRYDPSSFDFSHVSLAMKRHKTPTDLTVMLNTRCATDCVYCYADRRTLIDCQIPIDRLKELVKEASAFGARSFDVIGGEFFLYKHWEELLRTLKDNGFDPYISTKVPISEDYVMKIKEIGVKGLQVSLDTLNPENLVAILKVQPNYYEKIKKTLGYLEKHGVKTFVHSIITGINDNVQDVKTVYEFIRNFKCVDNWRLDMASASLYKPYENFLKVIKPNKEKVEKMVEYLKDIVDNGNPAFRIKYNLRMEEPSPDPAVNASLKARKFEDRSYCSANFSALFILPTGEVTVCEELYFNKRFIVGNVLEQGLLDIWNSPRAQEQYFIQQSDIPADSPCSTCNEFEECRRTKGICYRDTIKAFGEEKWYYPDSNCPKAPEALYEFSV